MPDIIIKKSPVFAIVVGEHSGDTLGAGLMSALLKHCPDAKFVGIGGPKMQALGFQSLYAMEELAVMGIVEVLGRLRRLLTVRKELVDYFTTNKPDVFIGVDAPDFNLTLEEKLKAKGIKTVQYVSPSVWAWREKRIFKIARATNMVLSLLPFEKAFYDKHQIPCTFVGHTLADDVPMFSDKSAARVKLGLPQDKKILAIMPGSRGGELARLVEPFLQTALQLHTNDSELYFVAPMITEKRLQQFNDMKAKIAPDLPVTTFVNQTQDVMAAADCLMIASGTVTLEAALIKRPMVVVYKVNWLTYYLIRKMIKLKWFSLPNLMVNKELIPELIQLNVDAENIYPLIHERLYQDQTHLIETFTQIHLELKQNASEKSADAIIALMTTEG
jgi:lipid-A-disaccharide synthase